MTSAAAEDDRFLHAFRGSFTSTLRWHQFDALWDHLRLLADGRWYVYAVGEDVPERPISASEYLEFLDEVAVLLREEHDEDYCGIVYADDLQHPSFVKIYDPNNLGVSCGYSDNPPLPGWVVSRLAPVDLPTRQPLPKNRRRWWQRLFPGAGE
jgi:Aspartate/tyrosine/aromatic aminotransferase